MYWLDRSACLERRRCSRAGHVRGSEHRVQRLLGLVAHPLVQHIALERVRLAAVVRQLPAAKRTGISTQRRRCARRAFVLLSTLLDSTEAAREQCLLPQLCRYATPTVLFAGEGLAPDLHKKQKMLGSELAHRIGPACFVKPRLNSELPLAQMYLMRRSVCTQQPLNMLRSHFKYTKSSTTSAYLQGGLELCVRRARTPWFSTKDFL